MQNSKDSSNYQDYVIKDGRLVGDFDGLYLNFDDPWHQSKPDNAFSSLRTLAISWCNQLRKKYDSNRVIELGCGFGHLTEQLRTLNFASIGMDVSEVAIKKAREMHPASTFVRGELNDFDRISQFDPDIFLMADISWYVLDDLNRFIKNLSLHNDHRKKPTFLIHLLTTYPPGVQKYGADKFTNLDEIKKYFNLNYIEYGCTQRPVENGPLSTATYFIAKI